MVKRICRYIENKANADASESTNKEVIVKEKDTYDTIALEFYNNPTYYWVICDYNRIIDPFTPPKAGTVLYLPSLNAGLEFEK